MTLSCIIYIDNRDLVVYIKTDGDKIQSKNNLNNCIDSFNIRNIP